MTTQSKADVSRPKLYAFTVHRVPFLPTPKKYKEALNIPKYKYIMLLEIEALLVNEAWELIALLIDKHVIGCKQVFRVKLKVDKTFDKYKGRLIAKGFLQVEGVGFFETFSIVVKLATIRVILTLIVSKGWSLRQVNVYNVFLNGEFFKDVFMV